MLDVAEAGARLRLESGLCQGWKQQGGENCNDGDDHEEFDQGETTLPSGGRFHKEFAMRWTSHTFGNSCHRALSVKLKPNTASFG